MRNHVRARQRALGLMKREIFVPQSYALGHEAQVDWYEVWADLGGERTSAGVRDDGERGSVPPRLPARDTATAP